MEAKERSFTFLGGAGQLVVPFFQRPYVWTEPNWSDLLDDLRTNESNFLGSIILKQQMQKVGDPTLALIIDGQQRLTTLSLLYRAIYDTFESQIQQNALDSLRKFLFFKKRSTDSEHHVKIAHSRLDNKAYASVIAGDLASDSINTGEQDHRIVQAYKYFRRSLAEWPKDDVIALFDRLGSEDHKILVVIDLAPTDKEQVIFDTINSAGVRLSSPDIVKNALFQQLLDSGMEKGVVEKLYIDLWEDVFEADADAVDFWEKDKVTGRLRRTNMEVLLHAYAVVGKFFDPERHTLSDLAQNYKARARDATTQDVKGLLGEIREYAVHYRNLFGLTEQFTFDEPVVRLLQILETLDISTLHPYILYLVRKYDTDQQTLGSKLHELERYILRGVVSGMLETKSLNKLCKDLIEDDSLIGQRIGEVPDKSVEMGLRSCTNKRAALILFWIELWRRHNDKKAQVRLLSYSYSLEHIMPQKWAEHWSPIPRRKKADGTDMSPDELRLFREERIGWLGNMTLLTSGLNTALRNFSFEKKINGEGRKKGLKDYSDLTIAKEIVEVYNAKQDWTEDDIEARQAALASEFLQIWPG